MLEAHAGHGDFPRVRTFRQLDSSTNNVFDDLKEAERWTGIQGKVDMAELTWEQRERILRMLFAKMNGFKEKRRYDIYFFALYVCICFMNEWNEQRRFHPLMSKFQVIINNNILGDFCTVLLLPTIFGCTGMQHMPLKSVLCVVLVSVGVKCYKAFVQM